MLFWWNLHLRRVTVLADLRVLMLVSLRNAGGWPLLDDDDDDDLVSLQFRRGRSSTPAGQPAGWSDFISGAGCCTFPTSGCSERAEIWDASSYGCCTCWFFTTSFFLFCICFCF